MCGWHRRSKNVVNEGERKKLEKGSLQRCPEASLSLGNAAFSGALRFGRDDVSQSHHPTHRGLYGHAAHISPPPSTLLHLIILLVLAAVVELNAASQGDACRSSGFLLGKFGKSNRAHDAECCVDGKKYPRYNCSPPVTAGGTNARMTVNSFAKGDDGGGPSECDNSYHSDSEKVVALSTRWHTGGSRCGKHVVVHANGRSVKAKVVDECDSLNGCDDEHDFQPPCPNDIVDASPAVWKALGIPESVGLQSITLTKA
ncbi:ripening-related protein 1 [Canna indica]|uniref:Ripening-related protein 1 n=1 Tax=Canna indica TaxID=4628 RepID=A0AAQ3KCE4_9LILI|nr:ripening-related protein 1 [Canna indica]